ncbi:MAG TPA: GNAT family N-acetyltransferase [Pseudonocardiaceae bacterium]
MLTIRRAEGDDWAAVWPLWHRVVATGETYMWSPSTPADAARAAWMLPPPAAVYVAELSAGTVVGTAQLRPNQPGLGDHVCNAAFMVDPDHGGQGIGRRLALHVIDDATRRGYRAMQFNAVVETNTAAVALWTSLGFSIIGTVPAAFRHARHGLVGTHVMHRAL